MDTLDDIVLLREYTEDHSEKAFAALVERYINQVYSVAVRHTGNSHSASEITQTVFVILAQKAPQFSRKVILAGWLYQTARLTATTYLRSEMRRVRREQEAVMDTDSKENNHWQAIAPLLDEALAKLNGTDRRAVILRFFDHRSMKEIGAALGTSEDAAKKRVDRAVEKLRRFFGRHGVNSTATMLAQAISTNCIQAAPTTLAKSIAVTALSSGGLAGGSNLALLTTTLKIMTWTKLKTAIAAGVIILLVATTAGVIVHRVEKRHTPNAASLTFAGYDTPEATLQSMIWGAGTGDIEKFLDCFTPEERERFKTKVLAGKSTDEIKTRAIALANAMTFYSVTQREIVADDEIHLHISAPPSPNGLRTGKSIVILKRINGEWKRAGDMD